MRLHEPGWSWSGSLAVQEPGEVLVKVRHRSRGETRLLRLDVTAARAGAGAGARGGACMTVSLLEATSFTPYRLENCSSETLRIQQQGCIEQEDVLRAYSAMPYSWDEPSQPHQVGSGAGVARAWRAGGGVGAIRGLLSTRV